MEKVVQTKDTEKPEKPSKPKRPDQIIFELKCRAEDFPCITYSALNPHTDDGRPLEKEIEKALTVGNIPERYHEAITHRIKVAVIEAYCKLESKESTAEDLVAHKAVAVKSALELLKQIIEELRESIAKERLSYSRFFTAYSIISFCFGGFYVYNADNDTSTVYVNVLLLICFMLTLLRGGTMGLFKGYEYTKKRRWTTFIVATIVFVAINVIHYI